MSGTRASLHRLLAGQRRGGEYSSHSNFHSAQFCYKKQAVLLHPQANSTHRQTVCSNNGNLGTDMITALSLLAQSLWWEAHIIACRKEAVLHHFMPTPTSAAPADIVYTVPLMWLQFNADPTQQSGTATSIEHK